METGLTSHNLEKELQVRERMTAVQRPDMRMVKPHKEPPSAHNLLAGSIAANLLARIASVTTLPIPVERSQTHM